MITVMSEDGRCGYNNNMKVFVVQSCLTLGYAMDYSPLGSSVHEILQAIILEWVAIPFLRGSLKGKLGIFFDPSSQ